MDDGMFDDVPLMNKARDKAWEAFTKRKNAATLFTDDKDFEFPLNGGFYAMWCVCWAKAWDAGLRTRRSTLWPVRWRRRSWLMT